MPRKAINKIEDTREYQLAYLFWQKFKKSKSCLQFRVAWKIPHEGFSSREEYKVWEGDLFKKTNERFESAEYKELIAQRDQMRIRVAEGKASQSDFLVFAYSIEETIPLDKYRMDIAHLMNFWDQPLYWRDFIEQCVLFKDPTIRPVIRPIPSPKALWDNDLQTYILRIENIFPDTPLIDFHAKHFTREYFRLVKKLPGYPKKKERFKESFETQKKYFDLKSEKSSQYGLGNKKLSDYELGDRLYEKTENGVQETKNKERAKKIRQRMEKFVRSRGQ